MPLPPDVAQANNIDPRQLAQIQQMLQADPRLKEMVRKLMEQRMGAQGQPGVTEQAPAPTAPDANPNFQPFNVKPSSPGPGMMGSNPLMGANSMMQPNSLMRPNPMMQAPTNVGPAPAPTQTPMAPANIPGAPAGMPPMGQRGPATQMPMVPNAPTNKPPGLTPEEMQMLRQILQSSGMFR